ncbi:ATP-dependent zinc metalloprotease FtsH [candidate division KSB1 bacterium]|nr:ATP-dependent zinc metalloprotease FtsH [candidate division KSB1 bacterium]
MNKKQNKKKIEKRVHFSIWYVLIAFLIMFTIQTFMVTSRIEEVAYSDFKQLVKADRIVECYVSRDKITGLMTNNSSVRASSLRTDGDEKSWLEQVKSFECVRVDDEALFNDLSEQGVKVTGKSNEPGILGVLFQWILPIVLLFGIWVFIFKRLNPTGGMMSIGKSKAKVYVEGETKVCFEDVAGIDEAVEEVKEIVDFLKNPKKFQTLGGRIPKGVLLVGAPGTGKTLLAKAVAGEARVPFFSLSGSDFVEMFVGVGAARVRDLFQQAVQKAPCIIFIDELDALGKSRSINPVSGGHDEREQTLNQLLTEMDGFDTNAGVIIMAATNRPEILDIALLRPGRFDRQIVVDRPDINGREAILKVHAKDVKLTNDVDLRAIAARTPGFAGADLANVINEAALLAARHEKKTVEMSDLEEAIDRVIAGLERKSRVMNQIEKKITAYHEAGHAVVGASLPNTDPVHRVSIIPRGVAALGHTLQLPTEDRYLKTKAELIDRLKVLLGGRVAEEIIFNEISTGAQNDLERATQIAHSMVAEFGMSEKIGPLSYGRGQRTLFFGNELPGERQYSERVAGEIDDEVRGMIEQAHEDVRNLLIKRKDLLQQLAERLLEKELLDDTELREILGDDANIHRSQG